MFCDRCSTHVWRHEKINICVTVWAWKALQHSFVEDLVPGTLAQCYRQVVDLGSNLGGLGLGYYGGIFEEAIQIQTPFLHSCPLLSSFLLPSRLPWAKELPTCPSTQTKEEQRPKSQKQWSKINLSSCVIMILRILSWWYGNRADWLICLYLPIRSTKLSSLILN